MKNLLMFIAHTLSLTALLANGTIVTAMIIGSFSRDLFPLGSFTVWVLVGSTVYLLAIGFPMLLYEESRQIGSRLLGGYDYRW